MGYMGFGMQRWIYNLKVRKPFGGRSKSDSSGFIPESDYLNKLLASKTRYKHFNNHQSFTPEYRKLLLEHLKLDRKAQRQKLALILLLTACIGGSGLYALFYLNKAENHQKIKQFSKELLTPAGKIKTILFVDENTQKVQSMEQYLNDSLVVKQPIELNN